jgi:hypothetical protein
VTDIRDLLELPDPSHVETRGGRLPLSLRLPRFGRPRLRVPRPRMRVHRPSHDRVTDLCFLLGLAAFAGGCGWIFPPAAPIVGGAFLAAVAWIEQRGRATAEDEPATRTVERWYSDDDNEEV